VNMGLLSVEDDLTSLLDSGGSVFENEDDEAAAGEDDDAAEKDDAAEEAEEDEEEEPSLAASALSMASDNTWSNGSIGSLRLAESLSGTALISLSDITLKSWPGRCHWS